MNLRELREDHDVVLMTGDRVHDAPALNNADMGVAGKSNRVSCSGSEARVGWILPCTQKGRRHGLGYGSGSREGRDEPFPWIYVSGCIQAACLHVDVHPVDPAVVTLLAGKLASPIGGLHRTVISLSAPPEPK